MGGLGFCFLRIPSSEPPDPADSHNFCPDLAGSSGCLGRTKPHDRQMITEVQEGLRESCPMRYYEVRKLENFSGTSSEGFRITAHVAWWLEKMKSRLLVRTEGENMNFAWSSTRPIGYGSTTSSMSGNSRSTGPPRTAGDGEAGAAGRESKSLLVSEGSASKRPSCRHSIPLARRFDLDRLRGILSGRIGPSRQTKHRYSGE